MITLATPIVHRITRLRVTGARGLDLLGDESEADIRIAAGGPGSAAESHLIVVRNGRCSGIADDDGQGRLVATAVQLPTGLDDLRTVVGAAVGVPAKKDAIETWLLGQQLLPAGTAT